MNIDGKLIARDIKNSLKEKIMKLSRPPRLDIIYAGKNPVIEGFLRMKQRMGEDIGVETVVHSFPSAVLQEILLEKIRSIAANKNSDGIIVQLPLPPNLDTEEILSAVPIEKDVDVLSNNALLFFEEGKLRISPPVVGAVAEILMRNKISVANKNAVVLGNGRLVGRPVSSWLKQHGAKVAIFDKTSGDPISSLQKADIIVSGVGAPTLIKPFMVQRDVALFDAGASEEAGEIKGDADPACSEKCAVFTPVPGGIGPITVALIFRNLLDIMKK